MKTAKMVSGLLLVLALVLSAASMPGCDGGDKGEDAYEQVRQVARTEIWEQINSGKASGGGVAVLDGGDVVYSEGFGMADREKSVPVNTDTIFNMGSISKAFVSTAVMLLVDEGKVELDAPVVRYLPEFRMEDPRYKDITVRMLLNHTSGMPGTPYANNNGYEYYAETNEQTLEYLARSHLKAAPGETAPYCNDGFTLAEMLVSSVSGKDYMGFLTAEVLEPLSLDRTGIGIAERDDPDYAALYQPYSGKKLPAEIVSCIGAGGLSSTPEDLVRFGDSFCGGTKVLSDSSTAEMTREQPSAFARAAMEESGVNPEMHYGLGFDLVEVDCYREKGIKVIGKGGDTDQYHSMLLSVPDHRVSVAVMEAGQGSSAQAVAFEVLDSVLVAKGLMQEETQVSVPPQPQIMPPEFQAFAGSYCGNKNSVRLSFDFSSNIAEIVVIKGGTASAPQPMTYRDGSLYMEDGTELRLISAGGRQCIVTPEWGKAYMTFQQRLPEPAEPLALGYDIDGKQWLRRNVKPFEETEETSNHLAVSSLYPELPGFVDFNGIKLIKSPDSAGMAVDAVNDLTELALFAEGGETWARVSDMIYSPADGANTLEEGTIAVTIGGEGYSEWLVAASDLVLAFVEPDKGRVIVFSPDGSSIYDSVIDAGEVYVPQGGLVELTGYSGDVFELTASPADD
ncbi:MAG: beta-lactamase family protein [Actinobacteria bacterium]|nr:beta-lactamase family protein [Actinomycetota bacterium]